ncbi:isochorismatase family cysteine hydrolase [Staphylococcus simiae]|uniref:Isochorismatase family protein n=1 Tax=Staphylococcus simiae CCM 7213 = CCUG 51256 TaxID=911238 RepID=G5JK43_9STAP|nr:isochorismatase family cysteine hydrolase [Staphylococcus simiae]EHJ07448.1 isochorismatase family protein [Staphylococcus simiae CCM 7213 = CCUG 51256]PNZ14942.1 cysteine hydrolase [Staphylococcus simiae]SNV84426.1 N-carbamoylsarcosine amidase [Staphylococcus simiae]
MSQKNALLVMDMQEGIARSMPRINNVIKANQRAIVAARNNDIPVFFIRLVLDKQFMDVSPNNKVFSNFKAQGYGMTEQDQSTTILEELAPLDSEPQIAKRRFSAFAGSELEVLLRANQIDHLILTGVSTSGVVLSTALAAVDKDYIVTVLEDAVGDRSDDKHDFIIEQILSRSCHIESVESWKGTL